MADAVVQIAPDGSGKFVDNSSLTVGSNTVYRQRLNIADPTTAAGLAVVINTTPVGTEYGLAVRLVGPLPAGTNTIGSLKITDGTNTPAVKAGSTPPQSSDPALVVAASPNSVQAIQGFQPTSTTGSITTATSVLGPFYVVAMNTIGVTIYGTYAGVSFVFEGSADTNYWFGIQGRRNDTGLVSAGVTLATNLATSWDIQIGAWSYFRVRATAWTSGSAAIGINTQTMAYEPAPSAIVQGAVQAGVALPTSPGIAPILIGGGSAGGAGNATALTIKPASTASATTDTALVTIPHPSGIQFIQGYQPAGTAGSITTASSVIGPMSTQSINVITVAIYGTYAGVTCVFEASVDNTNWFSVQGSRVDNGIVSSGLANGSTANLAWDIPIGAWSYFRVRATAYTSGTASVAMGGQSMPYEPAPSAIAQGVIQPGATMPTSPAVAPVLIGGGSAAGGTAASTATVKAATVAPTTSDTALVVTMHPSGQARNILCIATAIAGVTAVTTEALMALNVARDGATASSVTSISVTSGKKLHITSITVGLISTAAAVLSGRISLRMNPTGTVTATSTIIATLSVPSGAALAQAGNTVTLTIPDGIDLSSTMQFGLSHIESATTGTVWACINGYEY